MVILDASSAYMKAIEGYESDICFLQAPSKAIECFVCISFQYHAIRRVVNVTMQFLECLEGKAGEIS
jgi:hypothetical protein